MVDIYEMNHAEFINELSKRTTPQEVFKNAENIYDFLGVVFEQKFMDSLIREWSFQWYCDQTGDSYENIYNKWLGV